MFKSLLKAAIGTVLLPIDIVKDTVTLGGSITNEPSAIGKRFDQIGKNLDDALE